MKRPTHHYHAKCSLPDRPPMDVNLLLNAKRRSKKGPLTVHAFEVVIDGQTIVAWQTLEHFKKWEAVS
jgi:hypothetical protein